MIYIIYGLKLKIFWIEKYLKETQVNQPITPLYINIEELNYMVW